MVCDRRYEVGHHQHTAELSHRMWHCVFQVGLVTKMMMEVIRLQYSHLFHVCHGSMCDLQVSFSHTRRLLDQSFLHVWLCKSEHFSSHLCIISVLLLCLSLPKPLCAAGICSEM